MDPPKCKASSKRSHPGSKSIMHTKKIKVDDSNDTHINIQSLPDELLMHIINELPAMDRWSLGFSCRRFYNILPSIVSFQVLVVDDTFSHFHVDSEIYGLANFLGFAIEDLATNSRMPGSFHGPSLEVNQWKQHPHEFYDQELLDLMKPKSARVLLCDLTVNRLGYLDRLVRALSPYLESLTLEISSECRQVEPETVTKLDQFLSQLQLNELYLDVRMKGLNVPERVENLTLRDFGMFNGKPDDVIFPNIKHLHILNWVSPQSLGFSLYRFPNLEHLALAGLSYLKLPRFNGIAYPKTLKRVHLNCSDRLTEDVGGFPQVSQLPRVQTKVGIESFFGPKCVQVPRLVSNHPLEDNYESRRPHFSTDVVSNFRSDCCSRNLEVPAHWFSSWCIDFRWDSATMKAQLDRLNRVDFLECLYLICSFDPGRSAHHMEITTSRIDKVVVFFRGNEDVRSFLDEVATKLLSQVGQWEFRHSIELWDDSIFTGQIPNDDVAIATEWLQHHKPNLDTLVLEDALPKPGRITSRLAGYGHSVKHLSIHTKHDPVSIDDLHSCMGSHLESIKLSFATRGHFVRNELERLMGFPELRKVEIVQTLDSGDYVRASNLYYKSLAKLQKAVEKRQVRWPSNLSGVEVVVWKKRYNKPEFSRDWMAVTSLVRTPFGFHLSQRFYKRAMYVYNGEKDFC